MALAMSITAAALVLVTVIHLLKLIRYAYTTRAEKRLPFPPGPRPLPIIGNLFDIPKVSPWLKYRDLCRTHGPLLCLHVLGSTVIVVGDARTAVELFEKRSVTYASRPEFKMARLTGWEWNFVFSRYGQRWRERRRVFWQHFRPKAVPQYRDAQHESVRRLLARLSSSPDNLEEHLRYSLGALILGTTYGLPVAEEADENIAVFETALASVEFLISGSFLIEYFPALERLPPWLPGMGFMRRLAEMHRAAMEMRDMPWGGAKAKKTAGTLNEKSVVNSLFSKISQLSGAAAEATEMVAKDAAGTVYAAGVDTQYATLQRFFLAMALYPKVQKRAQAELDAVVGPSRLPDFSDRQELPYVNAILKETIRWYPALPMGVARCTTDNNVYNGWFVPKEATVLVNTWAIVNDAKTYPEPEKFVPERYLRDGKLDSDVPDPASVCFGFGRRICPGRYFADTTLYLFIASVLLTFDISPALDENGQPIKIEPRQTTGIISYLEDCRCTIKLRSRKIPPPHCAD